jgi:hypothetical protein
MSAPDFAPFPDTETAVLASELCLESERAGFADCLVIALSRGLIDPEAARELIRASAHSAGALIEALEDDEGTAILSNLYALPAVTFVDEETTI